MVDYRAHLSVANAGYIGVDHYTNGSAYWHYDDSLVADGYDPLKRQDIGDTGCGFQLQGNDMATCVNEDAGLYFCQVNSSCTSVTTGKEIVFNLRDAYARELGACANLCIEFSRFNWHIIKQTLNSAFQ